MAKNGALIVYFTSFLTKLIYLKQTPSPPPTWDSNGRSLREHNHTQRRTISGRHPKMTSLQSILKSYRLYVLGARFTKDVTPKITIKIYGDLSRKFFCDTGPGGSYLICGLGLFCTNQLGTLSIMRTCYVNTL